MIIIRLLPLIFAQLLFAAHIMRSHGLFWALAILTLLFTLFIRGRWIIRLWQALIALAALEWIRTTIVITQLRMDVGMPYTRMLIIMIAVVLYNLFVIFWLRRPGIKQYYSRINQKNT